MENKELVEAIERLGDMLGDIISIAVGIRDMIKKKDNNRLISNYNTDIMNVLRSLREGELYYTYFHSHYLGKLARRKN